MKTKRWLSCCWQLKLVRVLILLGLSNFACKAFAQSTPSNIQPDNTLGAESSQVVQNFQGQPVEVIAGGASRGINLFHSFREFNVSEGRGAYFLSPNTGIQNILARVTGGNPSEILGTLGTMGESKANLFLINPNGILFGNNATLNMQGAFVATTANGVQFGAQGTFSATSLEAPGLLTVNPSALLFNQISQSGIINRSRQLATTGSFYLVGGDITFDGGIAASQGNHLELGAIAGTGNVELIGNGNKMQLAFPEGVAKADIVLQNNAFALTTGGNAITVNARNVSLSGNSFISSVLQSGAGTLGVAAEDIVVNATGNVTLDGRSNITNQGLENSLGDTGNVAINAQSISLTNQSQIATISPRSRGNVILNAKENINLDSSSSINTIGIFNPIGKSGDITIEARNINLNNQSAISSENSGQGQGGKIALKAQEAISLNSGSRIASSSIASVFGRVNNQPSGDIEIKARKLTLDNINTLISSSNFDEGDGGNIQIVTDDSILLNGLALIFSSSTGRGNGGNVQMDTLTLTLANGGNVGTQSSGSGSSGNLLVNASDSVTLNGAATFIDLQTGEKRTTGSRLTTSSFGGGKSGELTINTQQLSINDGGEITTSTRLGRGGDLIINAKASVEVVGSSPSNRSTISTTTVGSGDAGSLNLSAGSLSIRSGARVNTSTFNKGNGGNLTVNADRSVELIGTSTDGRFFSALGAAAESGSSGNAGNLKITSQDLFVRDGAQISNGTFSSGKGGNLIINASKSVQLIGTSADNLFLSALGASANQGSTGDAGQLTITTQDLLVRDGAIVTNGTSGAGKGGNLTVNASNQVQLIGTSANGRVFSGLTTSAESNSSGNAGDMIVNTPVLLVNNGAEILANTKGAGNAGIMTINSSRISLDNKASINANTRTPNKDPNREQATINLNTQNLTLRRDSSITTNATGANVVGGNINIGAEFVIALENSRISANSDNSRGGQVRINAQGVFVGTKLSDVSKYITATSGVGLSGTVNVISPDNSTIQNNLNEVPQNIIDANALIANSCIARGNQKQEGSFTITGTGALPNRPGENVASVYTTGTVRNVSPIWKKGAPIIEPQGVYRLPDGQLIMSRECN